MWVCSKCNDQNSDDDCEYCICGKSKYSDSILEEELEIRKAINEGDLPNWCLMCRGFSDVSSQTILQKKLAYNKRVGTKVQLIGNITDVGELISLYAISFEGGKIVETCGVDLKYNSASFENILSKFSKGQTVRVIATVPKGTYQDIILELNSIIDYETEYQILQTKASELLEMKIVEDYFLRNRGTVSNTSSTKCFIATACYGDFNAPEVLLLSHYRDTVLLKTNEGKLFVKVYYFVSPALASIISKSNFLKNFVRKYFLNPVVIKLDQKNIF